MCKKSEMLQGLESFFSFKLVLVVGFNTSLERLSD